jgi:hypothetical protein
MDAKELPMTTETQIAAMTCEGLTDLLAAKVAEVAAQPGHSCEDSCRSFMIDHSCPKQG